MPEAFEDDVENKLPIVTSVPRLDIKNDDGKPTHLLIEAENYYALTCLNYTHKGKIDVIYIDPPYNTGLDGFRYKDKRILNKYPDGTEVPIDHPLRHSYWLSFMRKRLDLAKDLLSQNGTIFISIDDNEMAQLKLLCDEIFGERNLIEVFVWESIFRPSNMSQTTRKNAEYVLCYKRNIDTKIELVERWAEPQGEPSLTQNNNKFRPLFFPNNFVEIKLENGKYKAGKFGDVELLDDIQVDKNKIINAFRISGRFKWSQEYLNSEIANGVRIIIKGKSFIPYYLKDYKKTTLRPTKILPSDLVGDVLSANAELNQIFGKSPFKYPKPSSLVSFLIQTIQSANSKSFTILDFFAGSGTTGHAVLKLNKADGGNRQFILVTNDEGGIMSNVCYPRIKIVIKGNKKVKSLGNSFKYYRVNFVGEHGILNTTDRDKLTLAHNATELLAIAENTLEEVKKNDYYEIFENADRHTAIYFRENFDRFDEFVKKVLTLKKPVAVYIFSWENDPFVEEFEDRQGITVRTIPEPILEIYRRIYNL
ncbi:MAG: site-specific DNA-methyltransferase [bacterium]|nr:site-specific DNA-methyltransferase [bacterium]